MLMLTRRIGEEIVINQNVRVTVFDVRGKVVRIGVVTPKSVFVLRQEILPSQANSDAPRLCEDDPQERSSPRIKVRSSR